VERDLEGVLLDLADEFPLLAALVERRTGGQRSLPMGRGPGTLQPEITPAPQAAGAPAVNLPGVGADTVPMEETTRTVPSVAEPAAPPASEVAVPSAGGTPRPARYGLSIQFEAKPDDAELARLVETTIWINEAHPACRRAAASRSEGYHVALATAMALAPLAVEPAKEHVFLTTFLAAWGAALERRGVRRRR
jgi:hypothetical protein